MVAGFAQVLESPLRMAVFVVDMRADGHQPLHSSPSNVPIFLRDADGMRGIAAGFRRLTRFVDLQQHAHGDAARATALREIFSAKSRESTDSMVLTTGSTLPILLLCSWPIRWNGICSPAIVEAPASSATPNANPRSPQHAINPSAFAITSCGRFSPIIRTPASIAAMISPTSRVSWRQAGVRNLRHARHAARRCDAVQHTVTPSAICTARTPSIALIGKILMVHICSHVQPLAFNPNYLYQRRSPYDGLK